MLRDKNLVPLSRQHQHALALCVRLDRALQAGGVNPSSWQEEIQHSFEQEIMVHFAAEEKELFPVAAKFPELLPVLKELLEEHTLLRDLFSRATARTLDSASLKTFADALSAHIRKEERQLFEQMQRLMSATELASLGQVLELALKDVSSACLVPSAATRMMPKRTS